MTKNDVNDLDNNGKRCYFSSELVKANFCQTCRRDDMTLREAEVGVEYIVKNIQTDDEELDAFLFSLGCYSGEPITVISQMKGGCVVSIKDGRYNIDYLLAEAIEI